MIQIDNTLVSLDVLERQFLCDLSHCKGICCVEGDSGAPLLEEEVGENAAQRVLVVGAGRQHPHGARCGRCFKERRLRDIDIALADERGHETVKHREHERADLEAVVIGIGADDDLVPAQAAEVEGRQVLDVLVAHLDAAAHDAQQVRDDLALENAGIIRLQAVENFAADGHDALKLRVGHNKNNR